MQHEGSWTNFFSQVLSNLGCNFGSSSILKFNYTHRQKLSQKHSKIISFQFLIFSRFCKKRFFFYFEEKLLIKEKVGKKLQKNK